MASEEGKHFDNDL